MEANEWKLDGNRIGMEVPVSVSRIKGEMKLTRNKLASAMHFSPSSNSQKFRESEKEKWQMGCIGKGLILFGWNVTCLLIN